MPAADTQDATDAITHALTKALPEWRRHRGCGDKARCYVQHTEWVDTLLDYLADRAKRERG